MKRYFFVLRMRDEEQDDPFGTALPNDAAAHAYAERIIRELLEAGGYDDPDLEMIVLNDNRRTVATILFRSQSVLPRDRPGLCFLDS